MQETTFEWDDAKNIQNQMKHHVSFEKAQLAFLDAERVIAEDLNHSWNEQRYFCMGLVEGAVLTVRFTYRDERIRIIGAGYWRKGRKIYEQENRVHR